MIVQWDRHSQDKETITLRYRCRCCGDAKSKLCRANCNGISGIHIFHHVITASNLTLTVHELVACPQPVLFSLLDDRLSFYAPFVHLAKHLIRHHSRCLVSSYTVFRTALFVASRKPEQQEMDAPWVSRAQQQTPPPIYGKRRHRSSSPRPETESKRRARSIDRSPVCKTPLLDTTPKKLSPSSPSKPFRPEDNWSCPDCGRHCWLCKLPTTGPPERLELRDEEDLERVRMASETPPSTTDTSTNTSLIKKRKKNHYAQLGITFVGPRDQKFKDSILDTLGVYWADRPRSKEKPPLFLNSNSLPQSRVIIQSDDKALERIMMDFTECKARQYDEHSLASICCDSIILRDGWVENALANRKDQDRVITSVRRDKWKPRKQGPPLPESKFVYDWDLEPDSTYAVSIKMFNSEYRRTLHLDAYQSWVAEKDVSVCPYLTIEYKSSEKGGKEAQATNQAIAAAVLWLYQRKDLRKTVGESSNGLSHFMITLVDSNYIISEARLEGDEYIMRRHITGDLTWIDDLRLYIEWSNAIHAWGLGANASSFKKDIETLVEFRSAQAASDLLTPAATVSPMGPPSQKPGLSDDLTLHEQEEEIPVATKGTT